jgi:hypothetical protein
LRDYSLFYIPLKNFSLKNLAGLCLALKAFLYRAASAMARGLSFFRSYWMNHPIQSPLTTHKGKWGIYFNPDSQDPDLYTNVFTVLVILISITVTTVKAGRSFNIMMRIHKELQV